MSVQNFAVTGMTCDHCAMSVTKELERLDGVSDIKVDVPNGLVTVTSAQELTAEQVRAAVEEAGYEVAT